ncbi:MAG: hypothetical protein LBG48_04460 [Rickettsiales bacterium]|jgi:hypothetical protein|nr:hypothetical protein [Rickettsiales bacterium]
MTEDLEEIESIYKSIYGDIILEDFVILAKDNILNINIENYTYNDLSFKNIFDILNDNIIRNIDCNNKNFLNVASGAGKITIFTSLFYNFSNNFGIENIYEMYILSKTILDKIKTNPNKKYTALNNKKINFFLRDPLLVELGEYKLIVLDYNNNNRLFNELFQEKVEKEAKPGSIIIKIFSNFQESKHLKLLKTKILKNTVYKKSFMVFFYEKR